MMFRSISLSIVLLLAHSVYGQDSAQKTVAEIMQGIETEQLTFDGTEHTGYS